MKRFHLHVSVGDLEQSIRFYTALFGARPSRVKADYAKWMLEDPRVNFAISKRDPVTGVNHVGIEVDSAEALAALEADFRRADSEIVAEPNVTCCYAHGDKYWLTDPQGVAWEVFHTRGDAALYGQYRSIASLRAPGNPVCCAPPVNSAEPSAPATSC
jgi:catechol 2,3-dioxygenase-like lactoylglutathione lyase family enzyme